ncbi:MAG: YezD family protein [Verrucomicrobiales bacterium]|nr:YezD family protein [Verrucomicrobiales bacterium]
MASLRFGTVLITVHESRVVQVEKNEKVRLDQASSPVAKPGSRG